MENTFEEIWARIRKETGLRSLKNLADIVEISQPAVSEMKAKDKFPAGWAYLVGKKYGLLTEWIMTGEGPKTLEEFINEISFYVELEQWAKETGGSQNTAWLKSQIESFFPMFKEWKKRRDEREENKSGFPSSKVA